MALADRQNEQAWLQVLGAARWESVAARAIHVLRSVLDWVVLATAAAAAIGGKPVPVAGLYGLAWLVASRLVMLPAEKRRYRASAVLMEKFERHVFGLSAGLLIPRDQRSREEIIAAATRYSSYLTRLSKVPGLGRAVGKGHADDALRDWFPKQASGSEERNAVVAQRVAAEYSRLLAVQWSKMAIAILFLVALGVVAVGWAKGLSMAEFTASLVAPAAPAMLTLAEAIASARSGSAVRARVVAGCDALLATSPFPSVNAMDLVEVNSRLSYSWRAEGSSIPELLYWVSRSRREKVMVQAVTALSP